MTTGTLAEAHAATMPESKTTLEAPGFSRYTADTPVLRAEERRDGESEVRHEIMASDGEGWRGTVAAEACTDTVEGRVALHSLKGLEAGASTFSFLMNQGSTIADKFKLGHLLFSSCSE